MADLKAGSDSVLFNPADAIRVRRDTNTDTPLPADEPAAENPPNGAVIDYALPESTQGTVTLEVLDANGNLVRRYASDDKPEPTQEEMEKQLIPLYWLRSPQALPATAGMHRWVWDLRFAPPVATAYEYPISAVPHNTPRTPQGQLALPGKYEVRLTAGGRTLTAPLTVKMDPRVEASPEDLKSLFALTTELAGLVTDSAKADLEAHSAREQTEDRMKKAAPQLKASLEKQDEALTRLLTGNELTARAGEENQPGLDDLSNEALQLYRQVGQADTAPTAAQSAAAERLAHEVGEVRSKWEQMKESAIAELNRRLTSAHLAPLDLSAMPATMPQSGDED